VYNKKLRMKTNYRILFYRYFREQMLFSTNSFENVPFGEKSFHMKIPQEKMNIELGWICKK